MDWLGNVPRESWVLAAEVAGTFVAAVVSGVIVRLWRKHKKARELQQGKHE